MAHPLSDLKHKRDLAKFIFYNINTGGPGLTVLLLHWMRPTKQSKPWLISNCSPKDNNSITFTQLYVISNLSFMTKFIRMLMLYSENAQWTAISLSKLQRGQKYCKSMIKLNNSGTILQVIWSQTTALFWRTEMNIHINPYSNMACCDQFYDTNGDVKSVSSCARFEHAQCS